MVICEWAKVLDNVSYVSLDNSVRRDMWHNDAPISRTNTLLNDDKCNLIYYHRSLTTTHRSRRQVISLTKHTFYTSFPPSIIDSSPPRPGPRYRVYGHPIKNSPQIMWISWQSSDLLRIAAERSHPERMLCSSQRQMYFGYTIAGHWHLNR